MFTCYVPATFGEDLPKDSEVNFKRYTKLSNNYLKYTKQGRIFTICKNGRKEEERTPTEDNKFAAMNVMDKLCSDNMLNEVTIYYPTSAYVEDAIDSMGGKLKEQSLYEFTGSDIQHLTFKQEIKVKV